MSPELDKQLCEKYPEIFKDRHASMTTTCMCWGFECGDGWYNLLDAMCNTIQQHIKWTNEKEVKVSQVVATQVKEKYGTLRFYYNGGDDYIDGVTNFAELLSGSICESCGNVGKVNDGGWVKCRCENCE